MKIVIIGGGLAALAAALNLAGKHEIIIIETKQELGSMASSYKIDNYHIEKYYHHIFGACKGIWTLLRCMR